MRNPLSLCAVALSFALTSPASAATPLALNRADWDVIEISYSNPQLSAALTKTCDGGTLVASKAAVNEESHSLCKNSGFNCKIELVCVRLGADGTATQSPVDSTVLELTVYGPFGMNPDYKLNRGKYGSSVVVRDAKGTELTYVAPPAPVETKPTPGTVTQPAPKPKPKPKYPPIPKPNPKHPEPKPKSDASSPALSGLETSWLLPVERSAYEDGTKSNAPADLAKAYDAARKAVYKNLRDELKAPYQAKVDAKKYGEIDALLVDKEYKHEEVSLSADERAALAKLPKIKDSPYANPELDYEAAMRPILEPGTNLPKISEHVLAHQITVKYRAMIPTATPGTATDGTPKQLTDADFARVPVKADRDALQKAYNDDWAKADTNDKKNAVNKAYLAKIDKFAAAATKPPKGPKTGLDFKTVKTKDQFAALSGDDKKALCAMLDAGTPTGGTSNDCTDILANVDAATTKCMAAKGSDATATAKAKSDCLDKVNACKAGGSQRTSSVPTVDKPTADIVAACANFADNLRKGDGTGNGSNLTGKAPPDPCGGDAKKPKSDAKPGDAKPGDAKPGDAAPKDPSAQAGTDKDPCPKKDDPKPDANFYTNLGNGLAFGVGGLLLASFLGGPLLMLSVGLAAGVGGYYMSKSITDPPDKKK